MMFECGDPGFSALRAAYFLLLRQKKVSKEKATLVDAPLRGVPCATRLGRGLRNSALRASNSPRPLSAQTCVAQRLTRGPEYVAEQPAAPDF